MVQGAGKLKKSVNYNNWIVQFLSVKQLDGHYIKDSHSIVQNTKGQDLFKWPHSLTFGRAVRTEYERYERKVVL